MQKITKCAETTIMLLIWLMIVGCESRSPSGKNIMVIPELGVSVKIPAGWKLDNSSMCHKGDYTGILMYEPLEGKTFEELADQMSKEFGSVIVSKSPMEIAGFRAIKTVIDSPSTGVRLLRVYIHKGDNIIWLSYGVTKGEYTKYEQDLLRSVDSISINS